LSAAKVDLNPHQVDAATFALRSPLSNGVLLPDEAGLGKTIEAALIISKRWWERETPTRPSPIIGTSPRRAAHPPANLPRAAA